MRLALLFLSCLLSLWAREFSVASYNVENLFDLVHDGGEYKEYIPNSQNDWNEKNFSIKLSNIAKVIKEFDVDILALQEIENQNIAKLLNEKLGAQKYPFVYVTHFSKTTQLALFSRFEIKEKSILEIKNFPRDILHVKVKIDTNELNIYVNHWPAKYHGNQKRKEFAKKLIENLDEKAEYIILGDLNAPLEKQKDNWGESLEILKPYVKNLWLDYPSNERYSHGFFHSKKAIDHILISQNFFDGKGIEYKPQSFTVFKPKYLLDDKRNPIRWQITNKGKGKHLGSGFSDHLPLMAKFETQDYTKVFFEKSPLRSF